jgi:hypothetical protein
VFSPSPSEDIQVVKENERKKWIKGVGRTMN